MVMYLFDVGSLPLVSKGTHVIIPLVKHLEDERWEAKIVEQNGNKIKLSINSPANAVIGLYELTVTTSSPKGDATTTYTSSKNIVMLFNPWCEGKLAPMGTGKAGVGVGGLKPGNVEERKERRRLTDDWKNKKREDV